MPAQTVSDKDLRNAIATVFREYGYEGASVARFTAATGLQRSSLYHRFPGGKEEMALEVLKHVDEIFVTEILAPIFRPGDPGKRTKQVAEAMRRFYGDGTRWCLLETLSLASCTDAIQHQLQNTVAALVKALAVVAEESGASAAEAQRRARQVLVQLEGSLVLARITGDQTDFKKLISNIPHILVEGNLN